MNMLYVLFCGETYRTQLRMLNPLAVCESHASSDKWIPHGGPLYTVCWFPDCFVMAPSPLSRE